MSEFRRNPFTGEWTLYAENRKNKPYDFQWSHPMKKNGTNCPFCPEHEDWTTPAVYQDGEDGAWNIRVFPNMYPAVNMEDKERLVDDFYEQEMGAALKNVIALAAGMNDGLGFGDNTKAALMTRGMTEMTRLGIAMGGRAETFAGLSGMGDLIVTCTSMHSRNRRAGILLGQGKSLQETLDEVKMVVEGVNTVQAACHLAEKYHVDLPITQAINDVLFHGKDTKDAVLELMTRVGKPE